MPVTVVVSQRAGCAPAPAMGHDDLPALPSNLVGDGCTARSNAARSIPCWPLAAMAACTRWPCRCSRARGAMAKPVTTLIELEPARNLLHYFAGPSNATPLLSSSGGYGFGGGREHDLAPAGGKGLHPPGRRRNRVRASYTQRHHGRQAAAAKPHGLRASGWAHPHVRDHRELKIRQPAAAVA